MKRTCRLAVLLAVFLGAAAGCGATDEGSDCAGTVCDGACVDTSSDANHCGSCQNECDAGTACVDGACCPAGQLACDGACTDVSQRSDCGGCDQACADDEICATTGVQATGDDSVAVRSCTSCGDKTRCGNECADLQQNGEHCGACGNACGEGLACEAGTCVIDCSPGTTRCGNVCAQLQGDGAHCGACGVECRSDQLCWDGVCDCAPGNVLCDGTCVNLDRDATNCGTCGSVCRGRESCVDGTCQLVCAFGEIICGDRCVDPATDANHCGACAAPCNAGAECAAGVCGCPAPTAACGNLCIDITRDKQNCGGCGNVCADGERCDGGTCTSACRPNETFCDGRCFDFQTSPAHCGSCGAPCPAGEDCVAGVCEERLLPELSVDAGILANSISISNRTFTADSCAVVEGCVPEPGDRRLLRFSTRTPNHGTADLNIGPPAGNPNIVWSPCHGHYHFEEYAEYRLLDLQGNVAAVGHKQAFCLSDINRVDPAAPRTSGHYSCGNQGISMGWADTYSSGTDCQWVDITGVPPGDYMLEVAVNPVPIFAELDYTNNAVQVPVEIPLDPNVCVPTPEVCFNGIDEDCTGAADDGCPPIVGNDACADAWPITSSGVISAEVTPTTVDDVASSCGAAGGRDVIFRLDLAQEQLVYLSTFGSGVSTSLAVRSGSCTGTEVACVDDGCSTQQEQWVGVLPAGSHWVVVEAHGVAATSTVQLKVELAGCAGARPLTSGITVAGDTSTGTNTRTAGCPNGGAAPDELWYFTTCPGSRIASANTCGSATWDTMLSITRGTCGGTSLACGDDDSTCGSNRLASRLADVALNGDGLWFIAVDGYGANNAGPYDLTVTW